MHFRLKTDPLHAQTYVYTVKKYQDIYTHESSNSVQLQKLIPVTELLHNSTDGGGASLRWIINVGDNDEIQLGLQSLPTNLASVEGRPAFRRDACAGHLLAKTTLEGDFIRAGHLKGPRPILFSAHPDLARGSLSSKPTLAKATRGNINKLLTINR